MTNNFLLEISYLFFFSFYVVFIKWSNQMIECLNSIRIVIMIIMNIWAFSFYSFNSHFWSFFVVVFFFIEQKGIYLNWITVFFLLLFYLSFTRCNMFISNYRTMSPCQSTNPEMNKTRIWMWWYKYNNSRIKRIKMRKTNEWERWFSSYSWILRILLSLLLLLLLFLSSKYKIFSIICVIFNSLVFSFGLFF